jgi:hypothetical protein
MDGNVTITKEKEIIVFFEFSFITGYVVKDKPSLVNMKNSYSMVMRSTINNDETRRSQKGYT